MGVRGHGGVEEEAAVVGCHGFCHDVDQGVVVVAEDHLVHHQGAVESRQTPCLEVEGGEGRVPGEVYTDRMEAGGMESYEEGNAMGGEDTCGCHECGCRGENGCHDEASRDAGTSYGAPCTVVCL